MRRFPSFFRVSGKKGRRAMRKIALTAATGLLAVLALSFVAAPATEAKGGGGGHSGNEVVLLRCTQTGSQSVGVADSSSSAGAPTFAFDTSCSQALADLLDDGFEFQAVRGDDQFLYTMVKGKLRHSDD
jgi:hypothetical protein